MSPRRFSRSIHTVTASAISPVIATRPQRISCDCAVNMPSETPKLCVRVRAKIGSSSMLSPLRIASGPSMTHLTY